MNDIGKIIFGIVLVLFFVALVAAIVTSIRYEKEKKKNPSPPLYVKPRAGEVTPRRWATSSFSPSIFVGMSPTIYFVCGACRGETQLKVPMATVPYEGGLRLRCQCCGKPNRLPLRRC